MKIKAQIICSMLAVLSSQFVQAQPNQNGLRELNDGNEAPLSSQVLLANKAQKLPSSKFKVCAKYFELEIADSDEERMTGLMHRQGMTAGKGMLFVFPDSQIRQFWMRNVPFNIDIGYFDSQGKLLNALTMQGTSPLVKDELLARYPSAGAAQFAVELEEGAFKKLNLKKCRLAPLLKTKN